MRETESTKTFISVQYRMGEFDSPRRPKDGRLFPPRKWWAKTGGTRDTRIVGQSDHKRSWVHGLGQLGVRRPGRRKERVSFQDITKRKRYFDSVAGEGRSPARGSRASGACRKYPVGTLTPTQPFGGTGCIKNPAGIPGVSAPNHSERANIYSLKAGNACKPRKSHTHEQGNPSNWSCSQYTRMVPCAGLK